jgi:hypothetical protein
MSTYSVPQIYSIMLKIHTNVCVSWFYFFVNKVIWFKTENCKLIILGVYNYQKALAYMSLRVPALQYHHSTHSSISFGMRKYSQLCYQLSLTICLQLWEFSFLPFISFSFFVSPCLSFIWAFYISPLVTNPYIPGSSQMNEAVSGPPQLRLCHRKSAAGSMAAQRAASDLGICSCQ